jgi:cyclophilin family peptidyl-prolyl cis-trans isomerase
MKVPALVSPFFAASEFQIGVFVDASYARIQSPWLTPAATRTARNSSSAPSRPHGCVYPPHLPSSSPSLLTPPQSLPSQLDGKHVVYGRVIDGMDVVAYIEKVPKGSMDRPATPVVIKKSGELPVAAAEKEVRDEL